MALMSSDSPADKKNKTAGKNPTDSNPEPMAGKSEVPDFVSEDVYRFWKKYGGRIILYASVILLAFLGTQTWNFFQANRENKLAEEFKGLQSEAERLEFANRHNRKGIAGYVFLEAAGNAMQEKRYDDALVHYEDSLRSLRGMPLEGIALLGKATALERLGRIDDADAVFALVSENETFAKGIRAEATYHRIVLALDKGHRENAESLGFSLEAMDDMGFWLQRLEILKNYQ
jgi:hypothetical protein